MKAFLAMLLLIAPLSATAEVRVITGGDRMDDSSYSGISVGSRDGKAALFFLCDSGADTPRIALSQPHFLTSSGQRFQVAYRVDREPKREVEFIANANHQGGRYVAETSPELDMRSLSAAVRLRLAKHAVTDIREVREARLDDAEREAQDAQRAIADERMHLYTRFISDFANGRTALVRVYDFNGRAFDYDFDLSGITSKLGAMSACYRSD